ncbi:MAG: MAPEG family protein [Hellea sp.]
MAAMFGLTLIVLLALFRARFISVQSGAVRRIYFLTYSTRDTEPEAAIKLSRHFSNIFEAPTLFYIVSLLVMIAEITDFVFFSLAWLYVALRALHAFIHTGANQLRSRIAVYFIGWLVLAAMWAYLLFRATTNI